MKNKVLFIFLITAFINVFDNYCLGEDKKAIDRSESPNFEIISSKSNIDDSRFNYSNDGFDSIGVGYTPSRVKKYYIGPIFGLNFTNFNNIDLPTNSYTSTLQTKDVNGKGYYAGLSIVYPIGNPNKIHSTLDIQITYDKKSINIKKSNIINIPQFNNTSLNVPVKYTTDFGFSCINFNLFFTYSPLYNFLCGLKIGTGIVINSRSSQFLEITSTDNNIKFMDEQNIKFKDNNRTMIINDGKVPDFRIVQIYASPMIGYEILLGRMFVRITAGYDFSLISLKKNSDWNYGNIFVGVGVIFSM